jgi:hypothetical protein
MTEFGRQYFLAPVLLLAIISFGSVFTIRSGENENPQLKGSVSKVDRLHSWLRERAIDRLPLSTTNNTADYYEEVHETVNAMKRWASQSSDTHNHTNILVDVISIGSSSRMDYLHNQRDTWASPPFVRDILMATEMNTDRYILPEDASCRELDLSCAKSDETVGVDSDVKLRSRWLQTNNITNEISIVSDMKESHINATTTSIELCTQRRLGLAMGVSVRRYRKISHAFDLQRDTLGNESSSILPSFLIVTFDQMSYNTTDLKRCEEEKEISQIYAPSISLKQSKSKNYYTSFPYPTNRTGLIFNHAAIKRWMQQVPCSSADTQSYDSESFASNFCNWMKDAFSQPSNHPQNEFDSVLVRALKLSKEDSITDAKHQNQAKSVSDLFYNYALNMHLLCSNQHENVVPSGEEMIGYLIHRFNISDSPIDQSECMSELQVISS